MKWDLPENSAIQQPKEEIKDMEIITQYRGMINHSSITKP